MTNYWHVAFVLMLGIVHGCTPLPKQQVIDVKPTQVDLSQAAIATSASLEQLADVTYMSRDFQVSPERLHAADYQMTKLATINWSGPIEPLVRELAHLNHYRLEIFGKEPALPVLVHIKRKGAYSGDILRDAIVQAKDSVKVLVFPNNNIIELHYL